jgi:taurine---2-oxoglutarate transaminase
MGSIVATLDAMHDEGIVENAARVGADAIGPGLAELAAKHPSIGEVRGEGVFWAIELVADRDSREPLPAAAMGQVKAALLERGLLPFVQDNRIHVVPPCIVTDDDVAEAMAAYDGALSAVSL